MKENTENEEPEGGTGKRRWWWKEIITFILWFIVGGGGGCSGSAFSYDKGEGGKWQGALLQWPLNAMEALW